MDLSMLAETQLIGDAGLAILGAAVGCGLINVVGRFFGPLPEATTWAILFMNGLVPLIDRLTIPRTFGWVSRRAQS